MTICHKISKGVNIMKIKDKNIRTILSFVPLCLAVIGLIIFLFVPVVNLDRILLDDLKINGLGAICCKIEKSGDNTITYLGFSIGLLFALIFTIAGIVLSTLKKDLFRYIGALLLVLGGIFMFITVPFINYQYAIEYTVTLGIGAILGAIFAILGGLASAFNGYALK